VLETAWSLPALARAARLSPPAADPALARIAAAVAARLHPERERAARANAARLFPDLPPRRHAALARRAAAAHVRTVLEYLRALGDPPGAPAARVHLAAPDTLIAALASGRGLVACTAHIGNWELGALALRRLGQPVTVVAEPQYLPAWRGGVRAAKESAGVRAVAPERSAPALLRALRRGETVGLLVDGAGFARGLPARLAGHAVPLPAGPARLAARTGAVLAAGLCTRTRGGGFAVAVEPLGGTERGAVADVAALHAAMAAWLERALLAHPGEWCVFRPFFAEGAGDPAGRSAGARDAAATPLADAAATPLADAARRA
jgi:KDO2-lipid IV(A) lauroyltransferase